MSEAVELLPCPFCGSNAKLCHGGPGIWFVQCYFCLASGNDCGREKAIAAWNRRAPTAPKENDDE